MWSLNFPLWKYAFGQRSQNNFFNLKWTFSKCFFKSPRVVKTFWHKEQVWASFQLNRSLPLLNKVFTNVLNPCSSSFCFWFNLTTTEVVKSTGGRSGSGIESEELETETREFLNFHLSLATYTLALDLEASSTTIVWNSSGSTFMIDSKSKFSSISAIADWENTSKYEMIFTTN